MGWVSNESRQKLCIAWGFFFYRRQHHHHRLEATTCSCTQLSSENEDKWFSPHIVRPCSCRSFGRLFPNPRRVRSRVAPLGFAAAPHARQGEAEWMTGFPVRKGKRKVGRWRRALGCRRAVRAWKSRWSDAPYSSESLLPNRGPRPGLTPARNAHGQRVPRQPDPSHSAPRQRANEALFGSFYTLKRAFLYKRISHGRSTKYL